MRDLSGNLFGGLAFFILPLGIIVTFVGAIVCAFIPA